MSGYFGTKHQQRLQAQAEASVEFIDVTPGACQGGRFMSCDDPERLGWDRIREFLDRDGIFGFRHIPLGHLDALRSRLQAHGCRFDTWDVFLADRETALATSEATLSRGLPDELVEIPMPSDASSEQTARIQALMSDAGIVPFSGSLLAGALGPATTVAVASRDGTVVAAAHGYLPHNSHSAYHRHAWGGLVAVAAPHRGKGLGNYVNARVVVSAFLDLKASHIYELVSATNLPSRRMVEACGLRREPGLICGLATRTGNARFTR